MDDMPPKNWPTRGNWKGYCMYRCLPDIKPEEQARLRMIEETARSTEPVYHACIGGGTPIIAIVHGIRRWCRSKKIQAVGRLWCFHWDQHIQFARESMEQLDKRHKRDVDRGKIPFGRRRPLSNVVNWCSAESSRDGWEKAIRLLALGEIEGAPNSFGLIHHCGVGHAPEILSDFDTMLPMMGPETMLMINKLSQTEVQKAFRRLQNSGWDGLELNNMGILQRRSAPKEV